MAYRPARAIGRARLIILGLFAVGAVGIGYIQYAYAVPMKKCEQRSGWWDMRGRACATPVFIPDLTGRPAPAGTPRPKSPIRRAPAPAAA